MANVENNIEEKIIGTAKSLFVQNGYQRTSMSDIAAQAGINRPTLHYYFRTKEKMFEAVFGQLVQSFLPRIEVITQEDIPFRDKIERITDEYLAIYTANPSLPKFILTEMQRDVDHLLVVLQRLNFEKYLGTLIEMISAEERRGTINKVPLPVIFLTFFGQMAIPFMTKNLLECFLDDKEAGFEKFVVLWKQNVIRQMDTLFYGG